MISLVCPTVWKTYISSNSKFIKSEKEQLIHNFFNSTLSKLEYNKLIYSQLTEFFSKDYNQDDFDYMDIINQQIIFRNDMDLIESSEVQTISNLEDFYTSEYSKSNIFLVDDNSKTESNGIVNYSKIAKNSFSWYLSKLIAQQEGNCIQLNTNDFNSDAEINNLVNFMFLVKRFPDSKVYIQNSYKNLGGLLSHFKNKRVVYHISLYEQGKAKSTQEKSAEVSSIKSYFNNCSVKYSRNKTIIHPRNIVFGQFVIRLDNDFTEINKTYKNWFLNISVCNLRKLEMFNILSEYN